MTKNIFQKAISNDEILIDRKIRGCNIIKIKNIEELLRDIDKEKLKK